MFISARFFLGLTGAVLIAAVSAFGGALLAMRTRPAPSTITAQQFILVDQAGHVGAKLAWEKRQPAIELFDSEGHLRSSIFLEPNGVPDIYLYDGKHHARAALNLFDNGLPNLAFLDETGQHMVLTEYDANGSYNTVFFHYWRITNSRSGEPAYNGRHFEHTCSR